MDDEGWVPITTIADFKRVKKMCTDITFIIDSLLGSATVEVQVPLYFWWPTQITKDVGFREVERYADKLTRYGDVMNGQSGPQPLQTLCLTSKPQTSLVQHQERSINAPENSDSIDDRRNTSEEKAELSSDEKTLMLCMPSNTKHGTDGVQVDGGSQDYNAGLSGKLTSKSNCDSSIVKMNHDSDCLDHSEGIESVRLDDDGVEGMPSDMDMKNVGDLSNDFANTFMLDEELELEQKIIKKDDLFPVRRRAFHHYREQRDQKEPLMKHPELDRLLREVYRSLDDFRAKERATMMK
ncbi:unnamed protein product [Prunus armeniaca]|uniref:HTH La-type RNA-binding domain-containing protein n=1 Tax=Prunus armeniaca TaxID=36596 RepID=A0A6J5V2K0_PRUAR|nr:unnamed protein product [Prunus armeniaca]